MSFYMPSGMSAMRLESPPAGSEDEGVNEENDAGAEEDTNVVQNDGTLMQDLDLDEDEQPVTRTSRVSLQSKVGAVEDQIETLSFSDESDAENEPEDTSPEQLLQALAEVRKLSPRYQNITDAELLLTLQGRKAGGSKLEGDSGGGEASKCDLCGGVGGCAEACSARCVLEQEVTRWYEDVQEFELFADDES
jgi:ferredoxin